MVSLKLYDNPNKLTPLGLAILGAAFLLNAVPFYSNVHAYIKNRPKPVPLEADAIDASRYGRYYVNEDRDGNGMRESYFKDPVTGIEYIARLNPQTKDFTLTKTKK